MTDEPNTKNDDRLAGGGDRFIPDVRTDQGGHAYSVVAVAELLAENAALRQRCKQAEADARRYRFLADPQSIDPYGTHWRDAYNAVGDGRKEKEQIDEDVDTAIRVAALAHDAQEPT